MKCARLLPGGGAHSKTAKDEMKRDFDLIRIILLEFESRPPSNIPLKFKHNDYDPTIINAHMALLIEAGLLEGSIHDQMSGPKYAFPIGLTWEGHDFLDSIKDPTLWEKAKKNVIAPVGGVAFSVLKDWAVFEAKRHLGLP